MISERYQIMMDLVGQDKEHDLYYMGESHWKVFNRRVME